MYSYMKQATNAQEIDVAINQEEITEVNWLIHRALEHRTYITDVELRQLIDENCPGIAINTAEFTTYGLRNCLGYILHDSYSFNGPIISSLGKELSMAEVFAQYCDDREQVTTEELKTFARITGHNDVHDLNINDLCTINSEISDYTDIRHV